MDEIGDGAARARSRRQAGAAPDQAGRVARPGFVDVGVRGDLSELDDAPFADRDTPASSRREVHRRRRRVMGRRMETDDRVVVMGEDVHRLNGGTNGATRGLKDRFPDRVLGTPISENAFAGLAGGIALDGRFRRSWSSCTPTSCGSRPTSCSTRSPRRGTCSAATGACRSCCAARSRWAPATARSTRWTRPASSPPRRAGGSSRPSTPFDYVGPDEHRAALQDPVVVLEHVDLYTSTGRGRSTTSTTASRSARPRCAGPDDVTCSPTWHDAVRARGGRGVGDVDAEVIDLRWLDRASIDWDTIEESMTKTNQVLIAEQGALGTSYGGWLADEIHRRFFDLARRSRSGGSPAARRRPSISKVLERAAIASRARRGTANGRVIASPLARTIASRLTPASHSTQVDRHAGPAVGSSAAIVDARDQRIAPDATTLASTPVSTPQGHDARGTGTRASTAGTSSYEERPADSRVRRAIARRLTESKSTVPHFYVTAHVRVDALMELRKRVNATATRKISVNDFVLKAVASALVRVPAANAIWNTDSIRQFTGVDLCVAVALDNGLITPVIRGVDKLSLSQVSAAVVDLAERARAGRLQQHELEGGSFSVSNLGMYGVDEFSAILNPPQSGILAVSAAKPRPVVEDDGTLGVATVMTVTLSADHRVVDGALAAQWMQAFAALIEDPVSILV
jgi:pyruvate dehydrogenase complex dihydrolipoamide acetyltransferase long form